ncbi:MAG: AAA family ATPase [Planctomycetota bacterium]|nr:AAA family ATPase [Planctomycetota bacterium]
MREVRIPVVAITSGKGGVGKTTLSVNLSIALTRRGCRVSLVDADLGLANADVLCGMSPTTRVDALCDREPGVARSMDQIAVPAPGGFRLVPGSVGVARIASLGDDARRILLDGLADLERESDVILIDTGAGIHDAVSTFVRAADLVLVVATPEPTSIADAYALMKCVRAQSTEPPVFALVVNEVTGDAEALHVHQRLAATCKKFLGFPLPLVGIVRRDDAVEDAVRARRPLLIGTPRARASRDVGDLAGRVARTLNLESKVVRPAGRGLFGMFRS